METGSHTYKRTAQTHKIRKPKVKREMHLPKAIKAKEIPDSLLEEKNQQKSNGKAREELAQVV